MRSWVVTSWSARALVLEVQPVTSRALFGLGKLSFKLGDPCLEGDDHVGDRPATSR
jgi:hypothetical protein